MHTEIRFKTVTPPYEFLLNFVVYWALSLHVEVHYYIRRSKPTQWKQSQLSDHGRK